MKKISTLYEFERFMCLIVKEGANFLTPLKDIEDKFDFLKVYDKAIELASNYFRAEFTLTSIPFFLKLDLVNFVITILYGYEGNEYLLKNIYITPFNSNSRFLTELKSDYVACTNLARISCIANNYEWSYLLVNHLHENLNSISKKDYPSIIHNLAFLLETLSSQIQRLLYNDLDLLMNNDLVQFTFTFMQPDENKRQDTVVFKRLSTEYPEILNVYQQATNILNSLQIRNSILI